MCSYARAFCRVFMKEKEKWNELQQKDEMKRLLFKRWHLQISLDKKRFLEWGSLAIKEPWMSSEDEMNVGDAF